VPKNGRGKQTHPSSMPSVETRLEPSRRSESFRDRLSSRQADPQQPRAGRVRGDQRLQKVNFILRLC
jgi:hypothetical protein